MRYDKQITFVQQTDGYYDFDLGEHVDGELKETVKMANLTDLGTDTSIKVFGSIKEGALVIRLLKHYPDQFNFVLIDAKKYEVLREQKLRQKHTLIVQEVDMSG